MEQYCFCLPHKIQDYCNNCKIIIKTNQAATAADDSDRMRKVFESKAAGVRSLLSLMLLLMLLLSLLFLLMLLLSLLFLLSRVLLLLSFVWLILLLRGKCLKAKLLG